ncbi:MAG: AAA family ATPase, partial [Acetivibrio sp.]
MLQNLHVKNLALIDEVEVEFKQGLNILTGETGAGKSIILGSVGLALGGRYHADILRRGAEYGLVELTFSVESEAQAEKLRQIEIFPEEQHILLSRKIMENRSISRINGETVSLAQLKEVADILIDIYGQQEHQSLLYKKNHLVIVDAYAGNRISKAKEQVKSAYAAYQKAKDEWQKNALDEEACKRELSLLEFEVAEIEEARLTEGEDEKLESMYRKMTNSRKIVENVQEAYLFTGTSIQGNSASEMLSRAIRCLQEAVEYDEKAEALYSQLVEVDSLLNDFNRELSDYSKTFEFSQEEFAEMEERLNEINRLKTKYGKTISEIQEYSAQKSERLSILQDYENYQKKLEMLYAEKTKE